MHDLRTIRQWNDAAARRALLERLGRVAEWHARIRRDHYPMLPERAARLLTHLQRLTARLVTRLAELPMD